MMALLEINNLTKKYGKFVALDGVNLSLGEGKIVGLLGPNGSGKTTLMKCVAGLLTPDGGSITVDGKLIGAETKKIVSFLPERTYLRPTQTVASVLEYFSLFYEDFDVSAAEKMLNVLGVNRKAELKTLSKGTKEKVQLIAVMARRARLYLLDESIGGVDPAAREFIIETILSRFKSGATIVVSTHLIRDVEEILDEYVFVRGCRLGEPGSAKEVHESGRTIDEIFREEFRYSRPDAGRCENVFEDF